MAFVVPHSNAPIDCLTNFIRLLFGIVVEFGLACIEHTWKP